MIKKGETQVKTCENGHDVTVNVKWEMEQMFIYVVNEEILLSINLNKKALCTFNSVKELNLIYMSFLENVFYIMLVKKDEIDLCNSY